MGVTDPAGVEIPVCITVAIIVRESNETTWEVCGRSYLASRIRRLNYVLIFASYPASPRVTVYAARSIRVLYDGLRLRIVAIPSDQTTADMSVHRAARERLRNDAPVQ